MIWISIVLLPEAVLANKDEEEEDSCNKGANADAQEGFGDAVFDADDTGLGRSTKFDRLAPGEQRGSADTGAVVFVLEELKPVHDIRKVALIRESLGEGFEIHVRAQVCSIHNATLISRVFAFEVPARSEKGVVTWPLGLRGRR